MRKCLETYGGEKIYCFDDSFIRIEIDELKRKLKIYIYIEKCNTLRICVVISAEK